MSAEQRRTAHDLVQQVKNRLKPFRFLDLPLELREMIYDMVLDISKHSEAHEYGFRDYFRRLSPVTNRVMALRITEFQPCHTMNPPLLHVSRQVRSEAGKVYFGRNQFDLWIDNQYCACSLEAVMVWLKTMVGDLATHLRDVQVHIGHQAGKESFVGTLIRARFDQSQGLQITGSSESWEIENQGAPLEDETFFDMPSYVASLEKNRIAGAQRGEVIVDFFADPETLCRAWHDRCNRRRSPQDSGRPGSPENEWIEYDNKWGYGLFHGYDSSMKRYLDKVDDLRQYRLRMERERRRSSPR